MNKRAACFPAALLFFSFLMLSFPNGVTIFNTVDFTIIQRFTASQVLPGIKELGVIYARQHPPQGPAAAPCTVPEPDTV